MNRMRIASIVGARPQFIKAAVVSREIAARGSGGTAGLDETLIHTGQHYDDTMSDVFFSDLDLPAPDHELGLGGGSHGAMTGQMLEAIEHILVDLQPAWVLVYGDTNSTLAGALAAAKLHLPVAHVEAGLRSGNRHMPEEINRIVADHVADLLFTPTDTATENLAGEGILAGRIEQVGDVMFDAMQHHRAIAEQRSTILDDFDLEPGAYIMATVHRAENTDDRERLEGIVEGLSRLAGHHPVVLPIHPRTRNAVDEAGLADALRSAVRVIDPIGYLDMIRLEVDAALIATDSGGVQKEACFNRVPCITLRDETEWVELVERGANALVGTDPATIEATGASMLGMVVDPGDLYGDGQAARRIVDRLLQPGPDMAPSPTSSLVPGR